MNIHFFKYQATGNDFIIIDTVKQPFDENNEALVKHLCNRHFGIGADGLILFKKNNYYDFEMLYFNADGKPSTMCGNGGRCIVLYAYHNNYIEKKCRFLASDGTHEALITDNNSVKIKMADVKSIVKHFDGYQIDTGSPHFVIQATQSLNSLNINELGRTIRNEPRFQPNGINVNFVQVNENNKIYIRTYERGVEAETLSCGTGAVAAAIWGCRKLDDGNHIFHIYAKGGTLTIYLTKFQNTFQNIWLEGEAKMVFEGNIQV